MIYSKRQIDRFTKDYRGLLIVEEYKGAPTAFMTLAAANALIALQELVTFVPCSTRSPEQFSRVTLPIETKYVILDNGGKIIVDGVEDDEWTKAKFAEIAATSAAPTDIYADITEKFGNEDWFEKVSLTSDMFVAVIGKEFIPDELIDYVNSHLEEWNYRFSVQSRSIYMIPNAISKEGAAEEIKQRLGATKTFAAGDSFLDLGLMRWADDAIRPGHGELFDKGLAEEIRVATKSGVTAGEQILEFVELLSR
jgi:hydroxymethylpyrimidine pyrophosphatase-like HAD family hydrolase